MKAVRLPPWPYDFRHLAVALRRISPNFNHTGLLYRVEDSFSLFHLRWHCDVADEVQADSGYASVVVPVLEERAEVTVQFVQLVSESCKKQQIPYAFRHMGATFDRGGQLLFKQGERGLTCATFVLAVLRGAGIELLDHASWQGRVGDREW